MWYPVNIFYFMSTHPVGTCFVDLKSVVSVCGVWSQYQSSPPPFPLLLLLFFPLLLLLLLLLLLHAHISVTYLLTKCRRGRGATCYGWRGTCLENKREVIQDKSELHNLVRCE